MQNIALAKKIEFKPGKDENEGSIVVEPLYPGYGMTLGNSLRRVLLSSLPGAAVVGVKIKGISHEFMAMPGVKEDVLEILLNLKQLRLKIHTEEEVILELHVKGAKKITAADIAKNSDVEIANPELFLAETTAATSNLDLEIYVNEGRGYRMVEGNKKDGRDIGYIEIDSIFSPVLIVSIDVENTRVGKMTNWDKLVLNLKTDGTITPMEAFEQSVKVLVDQFSVLLPGAMEMLVEENSPEEEIAEGEVIEEESVEEEKPAKKAKKIK
ncbi:MAG: DNA-directed RNA polymerase subunit alpha [Candidatus Falkowbacteria bacterium]|nr:DNA-directed RNA polymerase subunit alpha [Candidatus Falkowbacteria bacterium]